MYIHELIGDKFELLERAMKHPGLSPKRNPTIEQALKVVVGEVEKAAVETLIARIRPELADMYDMFEIENGSYEETEAEQRTDWESALDDKVEEIFQVYEQNLSADWLARNTIDTRLFEENAIDSLAKSGAREIVKQLCAISTDELKQGVKEKSPAQILSNASILTSDVELYLDQHKAPMTAEKEEAMAEEADQNIEAVIQKVRDHVGTGFDVTEVYSTFELALDDDDILAYGAGGRLGLSEDDVEIIRLFVLTHGDDTANVLTAMLDDTSTVKKPQRRKAADKVKEPEAAPAIAGDAARVLTIIKNHTAEQDAAMANALGFSRASYNNYLNGKSPFKPDEMQKEILRGKVLENLNAVYEALCIIDGVDIERTWE